MIEDHYYLLSYSQGGSTCRKVGPMCGAFARFLLHTSDVIFWPIILAVVYLHVSYIGWTVKFLTVTVNGSVSFRSYGVVLWEIVTLAALPYCGSANEQIIDNVKNGVRNKLQPTPGCPPLLWVAIVTTAAAAVPQVIGLTNSMKHKSLHPASRASDILETVKR